MTIVNTKRHLENNMAWIEVMAEQNKNFKSIRGIAITGWQRYDHLATLCELFPVITIF
jgi:hexosaminidase